MPEPIDWLPDGTPYSPRFGDRYHSGANHGLDQARDAFLGSCGLPAAWAGLPQWRILETGFGFGLNFLVTWAAWRADPARPRVLHFVSTEAWPVGSADLLRAAPQDEELQPLAQQLAAQFWGLLPGVHRLSFEGGRVLLTLYIGDAQAMLRQQTLTVDAVYLDGFSPSQNPDLWSVHTLKAVARCCRRGTRLATWSVARTVRDGLAQCGFEVRKVPGVPPKRDNLQAVYAPHWEPRAAQPARIAAEPSRCLVIGGGLAGAAAAASLARRGWAVEVLDQGAAPAAGASGLPAGVFAPHVSPDDSLLSRLSRGGLRLTLQTARDLLREDADWGASGVLEHCLDGKRRLPAAWADGPGVDWSIPAGAESLAAAGLPSEAIANWHPHGGWIRPARLVEALLAQPGIRWRGHTRVDRLEQGMDANGRAQWRVLDQAGAVLAEAPLVVVAAGAGSIGLCTPFWPQAPLRPLRGQVSCAPCGNGSALPPFPVNGHGNLVPWVPGDEGPFWVLGSTFERGQEQLPLTPQETAAGHAANLLKLQDLLPGLAQELQSRFGPSGTVQAWAAVRCTVPDRVPVVGPIDPEALPGLWVSTAMGARGLTLSLVCGELLAARLHGEPLPLDGKLAHALSSERLRPSPAGTAAG